MRSLVTCLISTCALLLAACTGDKATAPEMVGSVAITSSSTTLQYGQSVQLVATVAGSSGNALTGRTVTWTSSNDSVATVSSSGLVSAGAVRGGTAETVTITASSEGKSANIAISIAPIPVSIVTPSVAQVSLFVGQTIQLGVTLKDVTGSTLSGRSVTWTSGTPGVATISTQGLVTAVTPGAAIVTATVDAKTATVSLTVRVVPVATVGITPSIASLNLGQTLQLKAVARDSAGNPLTDRKLEWRSTNPRVASVTENGFVVANDSGKTTISVASENNTTFSSITVNRVPLEGLPVVRLENQTGYKSLSQPNIPLKADVDYLFSVALRGSVSLTDDVVLTLTGDYVDGIRFEARPIQTKIRREGEWTIKEARFRLTKAGTYSPLLSIWREVQVRIVTDLRLVGPDSTNLIQNAHFARGLARWDYSAPATWHENVSRALASPLIPLPSPTRDKSRSLACTQARNQKWTPADSLDGKIVSYQAFNGKRTDLRIVEDSLIALLFPDQINATSAEVREIACRLNTSWLFYAATTGSQPAIRPVSLVFNNRSISYRKPTLAVVEETCGAGCGFVGATGIEIGTGIWLQTLQNYREGMETRAVFEYEMGRNFWLFANKLQSPRVEDVPYHLATAFATTMGYLSGVAAGAPTTRGNELVEWIQTFRDAYKWYEQAPDFSDLRTGGIAASRVHGGLLLYLEDRFGPGFLGRFYRALASLPNTQSIEDAANNFARAASQAAGTDLTAWFREKLGYPIR